MKKRLLSVLLVLIIVVSSFPVVALAADTEEITKIHVAGLPVREPGQVAIEGEKPSNTVTPYLGIRVKNSKWTTDTSDFSGTFEAGKAYYVLLECEAKPGYKFASSPRVTTTLGTVVAVEVNSDQTECTIKVRVITPTEFNITLVCDNGTINSGNVEKYTVGVGAILPTDVTKTGYEFDGWYEDEDFSGNSVAAISTTDTGNKVFYAKWTAIEYSITYDLNDATTDPNNPTTYTIETDTFALADPEKTGYDFDGWFTDDGTQVTEIAQGSTGDMELSAEWTPTVYNISYELDGGDDPGNPTTYTINDTVTLQAPTKTGYTFDGWTWPGQTEPEKNVLFSGSTGDKEYTAHWTVNQYTITFLDTGDTTIAPITQDYGTDVTVPEDPKKEGHEFIGWDKDIPGTMPAVDMEITALWDINEYTVTFVDYDGSLIDEQTVEHGSAATAPADPSREGYTFIGWDKAFTNITEPTIITALYKGCVVTFDANGGTWENGDTVKTTEVAAGDTLGIVGMPIPVKVGHRFDGWYTEDGASVYHGMTVESDLYAYARWLPLYTITVKASENGTVTTDKVTAVEGEIVTLTVTPADGYEVDAVTYSYGNETKTITAVDDVYSFTMPAANVEVTAEFAKESNGFLILLPGEDNPFVDVKPGDWFYDEVMDVYHAGLMTGLEWNKFGPHSQVTRAQIVTILWRLEGCPMDAEKSTFTDVVRNSWYSYAVDWAAAFDIVEGYSETSFGPNDPITREQFSAILYRYAKYAGYDVWSNQTELTGFVDAASVSGYALEPMQWAVGAGLMEGTNFQLMPQGTATRAQAAAILSRFLG